MGSTHICQLAEKLSAMCFPVRITETETGNNLFPQWCPLRNRNRNRNNLWAWSPREAAQMMIWDVVAHRRACLLEFWNKFSRVSSTPKTCFQTQKSWRFDNFSQIFDKCMCHVCNDVCGVCGEDWQVGHSEDKSKADQWVLKRRECSGFARVNKVTSASLGYPLSVFNKNSTLKLILFNHHPSPRCPLLWVFKIRIVRRRLVGSSYAWIP